MFYVVMRINILNNFIHSAQNYGMFSRRIHSTMSPVTPLQKDTVSFSSVKNLDNSRIKREILDIMRDLKEAIKNNDAKAIFNYFELHPQEDKNGLLTLYRYRQPSKEYTFADLGIDENALFKNIKEIKTDADFRGSKIKSLDKLKIIGGDANFRKSDVEDLGCLEYIGGNADFSVSKIKDLKHLRHIEGNADFGYSNITKMGELEFIGGDADFVSSKITNLGKINTIGGDADFVESNVKNLKNLKTVQGDIYLGGNGLKDLGNLEDIGGQVIFI